MIQDRLLEALESQGHLGRVLPVERLRNLEDELEDLCRRGLIDEGFYGERLLSLTFEPPEEMPDARSVIVVSSRDPQVRFVFQRLGRPVSLTVPPTYLHSVKKDDRVLRVISEILSSGGHRAVRAVVPKKILAVCSGLAEYGRNNITYVPGFGSFHRLSAFYCDLPCEDDEWVKPRIMDVCGHCTRCVGACPTGAIDPERFLLRAELCISFWNEQPEGVVFPDWLQASWHNCLVGCMLCQSVCPENEALLDWYEQGAEFSEEETEILVAGAPVTDLPATLAEKLNRWDMLEWASVSARNLQALLRANDPSRP